MIPRRYVIAGLGIGLAIVLAVILRPNRSDDGNQAAEPVANVSTGESAEPEGEFEGEVEGEEGRGGAEEAQEEAEVTEKRLEALAEARANGDFGQKIAATTAPATGWVGSKALSSNFDDWEPAVATDPKAPYIYFLTTRYATRDCGVHCPTPWIPLTISKDGGATWSPQVPICECDRSKAQYDPTIEVVPNTGAVYSAFLNLDRHNGFSTVFTKSTDHGQTWTEPVHVYGNVSWTDKPEITSSASGKDVYVSWNGPQGGDLYVGISHDFGETWTQKKLSDDKRYYYAYDARVLGDGTVIFSESSIVYSGLTNVSGEVWHHAVISRDKGDDLEERRRREGATRRELRRRRLLPRLLRGPDLGRGRRAGSSRLRVRGPDDRRGATARLRLDVDERRPDVEPRCAPLGERRERDPATARVVGRRKRPHLVHADRRPRSRRLERLVPELVERRRKLVLPGEDQRRARRRGRLHRRRRLRRDLRGLRRDRGDEHGQDGRHLGRGVQLHGPRRQLVQHPALNAP